MRLIHGASAALVAQAACFSSLPAEREAAALERAARPVAVDPAPAAPEPPAAPSPVAPPAPASADAPATEGDDPFAGATALTPALASAVALARSPRLEVARAAIRAAAAEVRRAAGRTDPELETMLAPAALPMSPALGLTLRWSFPWPGTRAARADAALAMAEVEVAGLDVVRRELGEAAAVAVHGLATLAATRELIAAHHHLMTTLRDSLPEVGMAAEASVDIAMRELDAVELDRSERLLTITLNALCHRAPDAPLPPVPPLDAPPAAPGPLADLLARAAEHNPEVAMALAKVAASRRDVAMTKAMNAPMLGVGASLDTMWSDLAMWPRVMFMIGLPLDQDRRDAAVDAARARVAAALAELAASQDEAAGEIAMRRAELQSDLEALAAADKVVALADARKALVAARGLPGAVAAASALLDARMKRLDLLRDAWVAAARLDSYVGRAPTPPQQPSGGPR